MLAAWYERPGPAMEVLEIGEMPDPEPGPGEVRVRLTVSGINPGDTKKRSDWVGYGMPYPRVIPHSDGAGVIDAVGDGVGADRIGQRVWVYGAQSYRPFGTAAQLTVVQDDQAVALPAGVSDEIGACLGIPGITAHRAVFSDGPVAGTTLLVHGVLGGVGSLAAQLAAWRGATVIGTVRLSGDLSRVPDTIPHRLALDEADSAAAIRRLAPDGVQRIVEVAFSDNADLDAAVAAPEAVIAAYATRNPRPEFDFWTMLFANLSIRLVGSDDVPVEAKRKAATELTAALQDGALIIPIADQLPLDRIAEAHDRIDAGTRGRLVLSIPQ
ncbi:MAG: NADPH:quinone reductase [Solirubrobacteraceae bacterium]